MKILAHLNGLLLNYFINFHKLYSLNVFMLKISKEYKPNKYLNRGV
jgi:hypothetical protein